MDTSHKGARGELLASSWLLARGLEVFRNVAASGPADLVAWEPLTGRTALIDVKSSSRCHINLNGSLSCPQVSLPVVARAAEKGVHILALVDGEVIGFAGPDPFSEG